MSKHTPGPWEVIQQDHAIVVRTESPTKTRFGASRYAAVGGFERSDPEQLAEALANASLIAAAPELLKALQALTHSLDYADLLHDDQRKAFKHARSVIAKAEGEKS